MAGDFIKNVGQQQARLNQVQNQLKTVNANIDKNSKATVQNNTDTATNTAALKDANKAVETSTANLEKLGQSKTGVQDEIDALNKQMSEVGEDDAQTKASYESQITDKEAELKAFDEEMKQAEKEAEEAKNDVKTYEAKDKELTKAAQDYDTEKANLEAEKAICEAEVEELENEIEKAKADAKADAENYQGGLASDGEDIASLKAAGQAMPTVGGAMSATQLQHAKLKH